MSPGLVVGTLVIAGAVGVVVGWVLRMIADGDRLTSLEHKWKDRLAAMQTELGHMTTRASTLTTDVRAKDDQILDRDRTIAALTMEASKIDALHGILRDKDRLINDLDERISGLTIALDDRTTALGQRDAESARASERQVALEREVESLKSELASMVPKAQIDSISAKHSEAQTTSGEELAKLKRQLAARDQALKDAAGKIATFEARAVEATTLRTRLAEAEARATEVAHRIEELEREVAARVPEADYHEAKTQIAELRGATSKLADVEIQLLSTGEQASELSQRVHELEERLREMVPRAQYDALSASLQAISARDEGATNSADTH
jgi:chromosome segregation ATPase